MPAPIESDFDLDELKRIDAELYRLAGLNTGSRLVLGQALHRLGRRFRELGFRTFAMYVRERASQNARWCSDSKALAERLEERPAIRAALASRRIGWSLAELLARHSTPEDEAELLAACVGLTVREVRTVLRERGTEVDDEEEEDVFRTIDISVSRTELLALEATKMGIEHVNGGMGEPGLWLECAVFEATSTMLELRPDLAHRFEDPPEVRRRRPDDAVAEEARTSPPLAAEDEDELRMEEPIETDDPVALDRIIVDLSARLASRDLWFGALLSRFLLARGWQRLGYASEQQWFDERLGMARATARRRVTLARRCEWLDGLWDAVVGAVVGYEKASLISRVANPDTLPAWIERARRRTYKHLREDVRAAELLAQIDGKAPQRAEPPTRQELEAVFAFERGVLSGETMTRSLLGGLAGGDEDAVSMSGGLAEGGDAVSMSGGIAEGDAAVSMSGGVAEGDAAVSMSGGPAKWPPGLPRLVCSDDGPGGWGLNGVPMSVSFATRDARMTVRARAEVILDYRRLEAVYRESGLPGSFVVFLATSFWSAWGPRFFEGDKWKAIYNRDRHRCTSPVCDSRSVTLHHITYRSRGGGDEAENLCSPCDFCHLEGEHGGRLKVRGTASEPHWWIGRVPVLEVKGRDVLRR
ncbi:MAG: HNH endonuclease [Sandaracinaceae bacterium]